MSFCNYKTSLGVPGKGFHKHMFGVAIGDIIGTLIFIFVFVYWTKYDFSLVASIVFFLAFMLHELFCIRDLD